MKTNRTWLAAALACAAAGVASAAQVIPDWVREKAAAVGKEVPVDAWGFEEWSGGWAFLTNATSALVPGEDVRVQFLVDAMDVEAIGMSGVSGASFAGAAGGTTLRAIGKANVFRLEGDDDSTWTFKGVRFVGAGDVGGAPQHGGAIDCEAGALELLDCSFTNFFARQTGGAVSARFLSGVSTVSNCTFSGNCAGPFNGYGGALYVSAVEGAEARIDVLKSTFSGNWAENGGAIDTHCRVWEYGDPFERPIALRVADDTAFVGNRATYGGGAIMDEGELWIEGTGTVFRANRAGYDGGAVAVNGVIDEFEPVTVTVTNGVTFADNLTSTNGWATGGAISLAAPGCTLKAFGATFTNNAVRVTGSSIFADGGAIYAAEDSTNLFFRCAFVDNFVEADPAYGYGGSIATEGGETAVDTCVFDCGANARSNCYGGAIDFSETRATILNTTVRRAQAEGVSAYLSSLAVTNCVLVGNGLDYYGIDLFLQDVTSFTTAYSAYGTVARDDSIVTLADLDTAFCLEGRTTGIYDGESLRLDGSGFNPVAGLGLVQPGVTDFVDVGYGTKDFGYSMGAYETPTERRVLNVYATRPYDGTSSSNDCAWAWSLTETNLTNAATYADFTQLTSLPTDRLPVPAFELMSWTFGAAEGEGPVGHYDSTNEATSAWYLAADIEPVGATNAWFATLLAYRFNGDITVASDIVVIFEPRDFAWTGSEVEPTNGFVRIDGSNVVVAVSNKLTGAILDVSEYEIGWRKNVDPTAGAELIVTCTNGNFAGTAITNGFSITAYITEYYTNWNPSAVSPVPDQLYGVVTNGALIGSNAVAKTDCYPVPDGLCLDWQYSTLSNTVYRYGDGTPPVTTLIVLYERDQNDDEVPDKYQKRVLFKIVNGYWEGDLTGVDTNVWLTLYKDGDAEKGVWKTDGKHVVLESEVPDAGSSVYGYKTGEGSWSSNPVGMEIGRNGFPICCYIPARETPDRPEKPVLRAVLKAARASAPETAAMTERLVITDFAFDGERSAAGRVVANIEDAQGNMILSDGASLAGCLIEVLGAESPAGPWERLGTVTVDADGTWRVGRLRNARFIRLRLAQD